MADAAEPTPPEFVRSVRLQPDADVRRALSGLEFFRRMLAGEFPLPPMVALLGFRMLEVEAGRVVFGADPSASIYNGMGVAHGGYAATLLDTAMSCAVNSAMPAGRRFTTLELKVNLTRPIRAEAGPIRCEGRLIHAGNRTATADGRVLDASGRLYAHGSTTCIVLADP